MGFLHIDTLVKTFILSFSADTGCHLEDLLSVIVNKNRWIEKESSEFMLLAQLDNDSIHTILKFLRNLSVAALYKAS